MVKSPFLNRRKSSPYAGVVKIKILPRQTPKEKGRK